MPISSLPPDKRERLVKLLGMCGSNHTGERENAASLADKLLREHGLGWGDILSDQAAPTNRAPATTRAARDWRGDLELLVRSTMLLSPWEREFVRNLEQRRVWSKKQSAIVARLADRL